MVSRNFHHILPPLIPPMLWEETRKSSSLLFTRGGLGRSKTFDTEIMSFQTTSYCLSF